MVVRAQIDFFEFYGKSGSSALDAFDRDIIVWDIFHIFCAQFFFGIHIFNLVQVWAVNSQGNDQGIRFIRLTPICGWVGEVGAKMTWVP